MSDGNGNSYQYDAEGNVIAMGGNTTAQYMYDAFNHRVQAQVGNNVTEYDYDYAGKRILTWVPGYGITEQQHYWDNRQFAYWAEDGSTYFEHQDALGTERMRTNSSGAISSEYSSSALPFNDGDSTVPSGYGSDQETLRFAGLDKDSATTSHAQFREYSQTHGRWMSPDPYDGSYDAGNPQSFNRYSYVGNNPLGYTDPSGQIMLAPGSGGGGNDDDDDFSSWLSDLFSWIGGGGKPKFSGSTGPRPSISEDGSLQASGDPDWTNPLSEHLGLKAGTPLGGGGIAGALGLPSGGCEFGACGDGSTDFTGNDSAQSNQTACINVNGRNVCPSPADKYNIFHGLGMLHYRSSDLICNTHVVIDPRTGVIVDDHVDGYNPNYDFYGHTRYDFIPDFVNRRYWTILQPGRQGCK